MGSTDAARVGSKQAAGKARENAVTDGSFPADPPNAPPVHADGSAATSWDPPAGMLRRVPTERREQVRLSLRIVIHLFWFGPQRPDDIAQPGATQQGLADALGATQGAVSKVLRRLVAANVVRSDRRHVRGRDRRVRAYSLSPRGEALARQIDPGSRR